MDLNKIFNVFNKQENDEELEYSNTFKFKMFIRLIKEGKNFKSNIVSSLKSSIQSLNVNEVELAGDYIIYIRSFYWLEQIDINNIEAEDLRGIDKDDLKICLFKCLKFYEDIEEYEKCAKLRDFQILLSTF
jgi:hypothetical protein